MTDQPAPGSPAAPVTAPARGTPSLNTLCVVGIVLLTAGDVAAAVLTTIPPGALGAITTPVVMGLFALLRNNEPPRDG